MDSNGDNVRGEAEDAARERLDRLFSRLDRLTTDDLAHVGLARHDGLDRRRVRVELGRAARASGREALVREARTAAREAMLRRYAAGSYQPTWAGLNWGLSMGRAEDRAAVVAAIEDAAAAAILADVLDPAVVAELEPDERHVLGLAGGAPEGSFRLPSGAWSRAAVVAGLAVLVVASWGVGGGPGLFVGLAAAIAIGASVLLRSPRDG